MPKVPAIAGRGNEQIRPPNEASEVYEVCTEQVLFPSTSRLLPRRREAMETGRGAQAGRFPQHTGGIRLVTLAGVEGHISTLDLRTAPMPGELLDALVRSELIIHNAAFELRWLGVKFGVIPQKVFCTLTADRLLSPSRAPRQQPRRRCRAAPGREGHKGTR